MISKIKKPVSILLALMMIVSLFTIVPMTASAAPAESLLITINSKGNSEFVSGSRTFNNIATVTFSDEVRNDDDSDGWYNASKSNKILSVAPAAGYTITKVKFYCEEGSAFDETAPFEATLYRYEMYVNGTSYGETGVTKIEVYGYATPADPVYALVGTMNGWNTADTTYQLVKNTNTSADEYMLLDFAADANTEFKVVKNGNYEAPTNNFTLNDAGVYDIYFRPNGGGNTADGWVDGKVFANNFRAPATYVAQIGDTKYETLEAAFAAAADGNTITLLADCAGNGIKALEGKFATGLTVDFNEHTYTVDGETVGSTGTETNGFQLLKNNKITFENGIITSAKAKILVQNYSDLTLNNMTLTLNNPNYTSAYTLSNNNGDVVINNTTIKANPAGGFAFDVCRFSSYPSVNVTVKGNSQINGDVEISASGSNAGNGFSLTLEGGDMSGNIVVDDSAKNLINNGGTVTKADDFEQDAPADYKWDSNGKLVPCEYVAENTTTGAKYETLEAAVAAAQDGNTITLLADCTGNGIKAPQGKFATNGLTVDFAGHTYTVDGATVGSSGTETQAFQLLKNNKITFKGGTITSTTALMLVQNYSDLTLKDMTLDGSNLVGNNRYTLSNNNGNVVIDGSTITAKAGEGNYAFDVCRYSSYPSVNVTVKGNSEINGNVEISASGNNAKDGFSLKLESGKLNGDIVLDPSAKAAMAAAPEKAVVSKAATFDQAAPADYKWDSTGKLVPCKYVAEVNGVKYETFEAAFAAAQDGNTITLLANCAGNGIIAPQGKFGTNGLTVDFGGYTYTVDGTTVGSTGTETNGFQLLKDNKITFRNGAITGGYADEQVMLILIQNYSNLTLDNMTLSMKGKYYDQYTLSNNNGNIVINNSTINAPDYSWLGYNGDPAVFRSYAFDVCRFASYPSVNVTVTAGSTINGSVEVSASNSDAKQGFSLTLESGTMTGNIVVADSAKNLINNGGTVNKADAFTKAAPEGFVWVDSATTGVQTLAKAVAKIGTTNYATLEAAFAAAQDGDTITLLADCAGNGIKAPQGKFATGLTVDFDGHTYTVDGATVGSTGTETNGFQLLKDNTITFKNGTITSTKAKILVQNYSNLTLNNMTLTLNNPNYTSAYTLSNNNGDIVIDGTTINANPAGGFAFDVCRYASYPSVNVTVTGESKINGSVEVSASDSAAKDGFSLTLESGTMTGNIVVDDSAKNLINNGGTVTKAADFKKAAPEGFVWVDSATSGVQTLAKAVAKIGTTNYATLEAAFAAAQDGDTITLLADCAGNGIKAPQGKFATGLTVDFDGHTYTVDGATVGSTGTETNGFQLLKDNKITFKNGTITSTKAKILVQNYSNLTLNNMTLTLNNPNYTSAYTLSNNNGDIVIDGTTINANPAGGFAFDVCRYASYPSVNVTVTGGSTINGSVEVSASGSNAGNGFSLNLNGGTMTGAIVLDDSAKAAMEKAPEKVSVNKATTFDKAAPEGYKWVDKEDGKQTLAKIVKLFDSHSITLDGDIGVNFFINPAAVGANDTATVSVKFTWDGQDRTVEATYDEEKELFKATCYVVAAEMANNIHAVATVNNVEQAEEDDYTVQEYAEELYNNPNAYAPTEEKAAKLKELAKALLNYGAMAQTVFVGDFTVQPTERANANLAAKDKTAYESVTADQIGAAIPEPASNMDKVAEKLGGKFYTSSVIYLNQNKLRLYFTPNTYPGTLPYGDQYTKIVEDYYYYVDSDPIPAAELDQQQHFSIGGVDFHYSALDYAKAVVENNKSTEAVNLAKALFCYYQAAKAYKAYIG